MKKAYLLLPLFFIACSHANPDIGKEEAVFVSQLSVAEVEAQLADTSKELSLLDGQIRSTESRLENFQSQRGTDPKKDSAVEGTAAELAALQSKRAVLLHRQHLLEGRKREQEKDKTDY